MRDIHLETKGKCTIISAMIIFINNSNQRNN